MAEGGLIVNLRHALGYPRLGIADLLFPEYCVLCGRFERSLCIQCTTLLQQNYLFGRCGGCGRLAEGMCLRCRRRLRPLETISALGSYQDERLKRLIVAMKYHAQPSLAGWLGCWLAEVCRRTVLVRPDIVTAIPMSRKRLRERGYNQAELLGRALARQVHVPFQPVLVTRRVDHQVGRSHQERWEGMSGAFQVRRRLSGMSVLLIDDVITTGATLVSAAKVLREAGACSVVASVVAYEP